MKITKRQLKRIIREEYSRLKRRGLIKEAWSSMPGWEQDLEDRAEMLGLERSDALLGAAMELESRDAELKYLGRDPKSGDDVYLRNDNTYTTVGANGQQDGLSEEDLSANDFFDAWQAGYDDARNHMPEADDAPREYYEGYEEGFKVIDQY